MEENSTLTTQKIGYRDILKQKQYMKTVIAALINRFGDSVDSIAFTWLVYQVTQSAAWSAIIFGINRLPTIFLQPIAGAWVESRNKKKIMVVTDVIRGICVGFIATAMLLGFLNQWLLLGSTIIISCAEAFRQPASAAMLPKLLDKKYYEFGLALSSSTASAMELIGLAAAAVIIGTFGVSTAIYIDAVTFFVSAAIILTLRVKEELVVRVKVSIKEYKKDLKEGFLYIRDRRYLRYFVILAVYLNGILVPFNSLQSPLVSEILHANEVMLSVIGGFLTIGMLVGSVSFPYVRAKFSERFLIVCGGYSIGVYYLLLLVIGQFCKQEILLYVCVAFVTFLFAICIALLSSFANAEFMKSVEQNYMARVASLFSAGCVASMPIVSFIVSLLANFLETSIIFIISGVCGILFGIFYCSKKRIQRLVASNDGITDSQAVIDVSSDSIDVIEVSTETLIMNDHEDELKLDA